MIEQQRLDKAAMSKQVGHVQMRMIDIFWWDEVRRHLDVFIYS